MVNVFVEQSLFRRQPNFVPAGLFQDDVAFEFTEQIYIDMKPSYYDFANRTLNLTEAEVLAKFGISENSES